MAKNAVKLENFSKQLKEITALLEGSREFITGDYINDFRRDTHLIEHDVQDILNTDRNMKVGIIGGIKAGKSTFLNALIFDGESVLPQAATPMTAALTRMVYSEKKNYAKIHFYTKDGWAGIKRLAEEFDEKLDHLVAEKLREKQKALERMQKFKNMQSSSSQSHAIEVTPAEKERLKKKLPESLRSSRQLVDMALKNRLDAEKYLGTEGEIDLGTDIHQGLADYVGAKGRFTPIVSYIELGLDNSLLKGMEVIDTPGLDDPVIARSKVTKNYLAHCDVVFVLSRGSAFLTGEDKKLIDSVLPAEGVKVKKLIASQFDNVALDYNPNQSGKKTVQEVWNDFGKETIKTARIWWQARKEKEEMKPMLVSSLFYSAARKMEKKQTLSEEEEHVLTQFETNFIGFTRTPEMLYELSQIHTIRNNVWEEIRKKKEEILEQKSKDFVADKKAGCLEKLREIRSQVENNLSHLQNVDKEGLRQKEKQIRRVLEKSRNKIRDIFGNCAYESKRKVMDLQSEIRKTVDRYQYIQSKDIVKTVTRSRKESKWFFWEKTVYYNVDVHHDQANVADAENNIEKYMADAQAEINNRLSSVINMAEMRRTLKEELLTVLNENSEDTFESDDVILPVNKILREINDPKVRIDGNKYSSALEKIFQNNQVLDEDIARLKREQNRILWQISGDACERLGDEAARIKNELINKADSFVGDVQKKLSNNMDLVRANLENKEKSIAVYGKLKTSLQEHIAKLQDDKL
ncbi:dynamin family protein [Dialister invisus]|mgnify:FL=1|uniref:dynamin family protein n=1 Tax=Dialister invisus TaxID=218538 RepID=UPI0026DBBC45|nr:dynamin family protein [Dialister invisus]